MIAAGWVALALAVVGVGSLASLILLFAAGRRLAAVHVASGDLLGRDDVCPSGSILIGPDGVW